MRIESKHIQTGKVSEKSNSSRQRALEFECHQGEYTNKRKHSHRGQLKRPRLCPSQGTPSGGCTPGTCPSCHASFLTWGLNAHELGPDSNLSSAGLGLAWSSLYAIQFLLSFQAAEPVSAKGIHFPPRRVLLWPTQIIAGRLWWAAKKTQNRSSLVTPLIFCCPSSIWSTLEPSDCYEPQFPRLTHNTAHWSALKGSLPEKQLEKLEPFVLFLEAFIWQWQYCPCLTQSSLSLQLWNKTLVLNWESSSIF